MLTGVLSSFSKVPSRTTIVRGDGNDAYVVRVSRDFAAISYSWTAMLENGAACVFQSEEWIRCWLQTIGKTRDVGALFVKILDAETRQPLMLLPLVRRRTRTITLIEVPDFGLADYTGPAFSSSFLPSKDTMARLWAEIVRNLPDADVIRLVKMPAVINGIANPLMLLDGFGKSDLSAFGTSISAPFEAYESKIMSAKFIADMDARWRKLNKRGMVEFRVAETPAEKIRFFNAMREQRDVRFREMNLPNALEKPEIRDFFRDMLVGPGATGATVIQALLIDGEIIATGYGHVGNDAFHMIFPTFMADKWRNYSPGRHLFRKSMAWAAGQGLSYYDFTVGAEGFKRDFGSSEMQLFERYQALTLPGVLPIACIASRRFIKGSPRLAGVYRTLKTTLNSWRT